MKPATAFSYSCARCGRCCIDKRIQVNPYEIARLARGRGQGTAEFRDSSTDGGSWLRQREDGACVFFDAETGCTVHADRPLVCRLFPLGRRVSETGEVSYWRGDFTPPPSGAFGEDGTLGDFLAGQGAAPFIVFADGYFRWLLKASHEFARVREDMVMPDDPLDIDGVLAWHCADAGETEPVSVEDRAGLHLRILEGLVIIAGEN